MCRCIGIVLKRIFIGSGKAPPVHRQHTKKCKWGHIASNSRAGKNHRIRAKAFISAIFCADSNSGGAWHGHILYTPTPRGLRSRGRGRVQGVGKGGDIQDRDWLQLTDHSRVVSSLMKTFWYFPEDTHLQISAIWISIRWWKKGKFTGK